MHTWLPVPVYKYPAHFITSRALIFVKWLFLIFFVDDRNLEVIASLFSSRKLAIDTNVKVHWVSQVAVQVYISLALEIIDIRHISSDAWQHTLNSTYNSFGVLW